MNLSLETLKRFAEWHTLIWGLKFGAFLKFEV